MSREGCNRVVGLCLYLFLNEEQIAQQFRSLLS